MSRESETEAKEIETMKEETESNTEIEAASDRISVNYKLENPNEKIPYVVPLGKEYNFEGEIIKEVDLSGLEDLTTLDAQKLDRVMAKMQHYPTKKFEDILYAKHIAMMATGLPVEFFNGLSFKDMMSIASRVKIYFLY